MDIKELERREAECYNRIVEIYDTKWECLPPTEFRWKLRRERIKFFIKYWEHEALRARLFISNIENAIKIYKEEEEGIIEWWRRPFPEVYDWGDGSMEDWELTVDAS